MLKQHQQYKVAAQPPQSRQIAKAPSIIQESWVCSLDPLPDSVAGSYHDFDMEKLINSPFFWGLILGLFIGFCLLYVSWSKRSLLRKQFKEKSEELETLRKHLDTQMSINAKGNEQVTVEVEKLRDQNENLRVNLETLKTKPGKAETRTLHIYDKALHLMYEQAPGFASHWERAIKEAESDMMESESGLKKLITKVFRPSLNAPSLAKELPGKTDQDQSTT